VTAPAVDSAPNRPAGGERAPRPVALPGVVNSALFWPFWCGVRLGARLLLRMRIENPPRLTGAFVLAANHASYLDPLLLGSALPRRVIYLMTEVVWRSPLMGWFYRWNHTIPVAPRGGNRDALRTARSVLQQGRVIGIFPEGGLSRDGGLMLGSPGAVSLVLNEEVPIVPVGILGADRVLPVGCVLPRLHKVVIRFGEPILPAELAALAANDRKQRLQAATTLIMARIAELTGRVPREREIATAPPPR